MLNRLTSKDFWKATGIRALYTLCETVLALVPSSAVILSDVNWKYVISAGALATILSVIKSIMFGVPEVEK